MEHKNKIYSKRFVPLRSDSGFKAVFMEKSNKDHLISHYQFMETRTKELANPTISVNFAELERFDKSAEECRTELDCLLYWFIHCGDLDIIPDTIIRNEFVSKLIEATEIASMTPDQKLRFENDIMSR